MPPRVSKSSIVPMPVTELNPAKLTCIISLIETCWIENPRAAATKMPSAKLGSAANFLTDTNIRAIGGISINGLITKLFSRTPSISMTLTPSTTIPL